jgi:hypothetical protein
LIPGSAARYNVPGEEKMLRRALSIYLAVLVVAAPCLCCCTAGRAMAAVAPPIQSPPSCCHHEAPSAPRPSAPDSPDRCPCRDHAEKQVLANPTGDSGHVSSPFDSAAVDFVAAIFPTGGPSAIELSDRRHPGTPHPTTADLLYSHHRLRC